MRDVISQLPFVYQLTGNFMQIKYCLILTLGCLSVPATAKVQCPSNEFLQARYEVVTSSGEQELKRADLTLIRAANKVAHRFDEANISEVWFHNSHQQIVPTRYFETYKRAIEYSPVEKIHGKQERDWSLRFQLVSDLQIGQMQKIATIGKDCEQIDTYQMTTPAATVTLKWNPALLLVESLERSTGQNKVVWTRKNIDFDKKQILAYFAQFNDYQTTDYADIGDDHTDPFLAKMIKLGFIEDGASGFYDDQGTALSGQHSH